MRLLAYIDLPSGSAIFQFLIAGLLGVSVAFRSFWRRVWQALTGRSRRGTSSQGGSDVEAGPSGEVEAGPASSVEDDAPGATAEHKSELPARKG